MSSLPFVSICLLTYRRCSLLPETLDSLLAQTHSNFELIINDDNSPDDTQKVCEAYANRDVRVKYYKNPTNLRYAGNQNAAISRASGDFVAIVHDGDKYRSDLIERWTKALIAHPTAALVFNGLQALNERREIVKTHIHPYSPFVPGRTLLREMLLRPDSPIFGIVMVRRACVLKAGPFDTALPTLADVDMWMRLLGEHDAAYIPDTLLQIACREKNHHNNPGNWRIFKEYSAIYHQNLERFFRRDPREYNEMRESIQRMLRRERRRRLLWCLRKLRWGDFVEGLA